MIQALKPVCHFMAEDIPPPVLNQLVIRYLVNLLVRIKEPSSPTRWEQSPQPQTEDTKKSRKLDCVVTGFIYDDAINITVDVRPSHILCLLCSAYSSGVGVTKPISSVPLFSEFFSIIKTHVSYWISRLYLTGVAAAQLRWHLSNINVIRII